MWDICSFIRFLVRLYFRAGYFVICWSNNDSIERCVTRTMLPVCIPPTAGVDHVTCVYPAHSRLDHVTYVCPANTRLDHVTCVSRQAQLGPCYLCVSHPQQVGQCELCVPYLCVFSGVSSAVPCPWTCDDTAHTLAKIYLEYNYYKKIK